MSEPTAPMLFAGNPEDDDGIVIDSLVQEMDTTPAPDQMPVESGQTVPVSERPKTTTLMYSGYTLLPNTFDPVQILTADPNRKALIIRATSSTVTDSIRIADDPGKMMEPTGALNGMSGRLPVGNDENFTGHTGPVWVSAKDAAASVLISWWAPTGDDDK